eukprot:jgi/Bigna1/145835/aug1.104_g20543
MMGFSEREMPACMTAAALSPLDEDKDDSFGTLAHLIEMEQTDEVDFFRLVVRAKVMFFVMITATVQHVFRGFIVKNPSVKVVNGILRRRNPV